MIEIAVVVPAYNQEMFIARALDSVLRQTVAASEVIVVDDGSRDRTAEVVRRFSGVTLMQQANRERGATRNAGILHAKAEWIALLDADDEWSPTHLEHATRVILESHCDVTFGAFNLVDSAGRVIGVKRPWNARRYRDPTRVFRQIDSGGICASNIVAKRQRLLETPFSEARPMSGSEDWHCWARLCLRAAVAPFSEVTVNYHLHGANTVFDSKRMVVAMHTAVEDLVARPELAPYARQVARRLQLFSAGQLRAAGQPRSALRLIAQAVRADPISLLESRLWRTGLRSAFDIGVGRSEPPSQG